MEDTGAARNDRNGGFDPIPPPAAMRQAPPFRKGGRPDALPRLETEDLLLGLILYLLYRESRDEEFLIMLAAVLLG